MCVTSIITVNYNQPQLTLALLESIRRNYADEMVEVILVDNASNQDHEDLFMSCYPPLKYIRSAVNLGFAGGNNLGIRQASGQYILMVNNDTEIIPGFIEQLIEEMEAHPEIGILSPLILYYDNPDMIQYAGFTAMNYRTGRNSTIGLHNINRHQYQQISQPTSFCHGAAMMCRKADVQQVGLMPEQYFLYYEELDWCEMFKRSGKQIWFTGKTHIFHKESMSVGKESAIKTYFITRNRLLFIRRNTSKMNVAFFSAYYLLFAVPKQFIHYVFKRRFDLLPPLGKGIFWNLRHSRNHLEASRK